MINTSLNTSGKFMQTASHTFATFSTKFSPPRFIKQILQKQFFFNHLSLTDKFCYFKMTRRMCIIVAIFRFFVKQVCQLQKIDLRFSRRLRRSRQFSLVISTIPIQLQTLTLNENSMKNALKIDIHPEQERNAA